jgi:hypothetical protein
MSLRTLAVRQASGGRWQELADRTRRRRNDPLTAGFEKGP